MKARDLLLKIVLPTIAAGLLMALAMAPVAGFSGAAVARTNDAMQSDLSDMIGEEMPGVTTVTDVTGAPIAHIYDQRRYQVEPDEISQNMKDAIVAIEDHRFYEHEGVDLQGFARAIVTNLMAGGVEQGASTIHQQYVKNYLLHVSADSTEEQASATEQSVTRKLREMRMATELDDQLSKDQILTNYLNVVSFGNHAYGIEAAAQTYFGIPASELTVPQSAMLAGMVQSSEFLNPYTNTDAVVDRRNTVLQSMVNFGAIDQATADAHAAEPLGVLDQPATLPNGCIGAGDRGFFCDYAINYLHEQGITDEQLRNDSLLITTTLDPQVQDAAHDTVTSMVDPNQPGVAEVLNVVEPGQDSRDVLAMTSSRDYGLDLEAGETYLPQPWSMVGNGAGSIFKVFTAAAALEHGIGLDDELPVPTRYEAEGMGAGGAENCPANTYCVENAGTYQPSMSLEEALAHSPNTTFIQLIEEVGVPAVVDMSVKLGLRSYAEPGSYNEDYSIADYFKEANLGSYTLGPTAVNPLELSNVGATLGSSGMWCEPNPIVSVHNEDGEEIALDQPACEQVVEPELADSLAEAMTADVEIGTARGAAGATGFSGVSAAKTGTTESNQSSAFLGFNDSFAAAPYIYNDGTTTTSLCTSPVRQCNSGNLYGGLEPARTYFSVFNQVPQANQGGLRGSAADEYREGSGDHDLSDDSADASAETASNSQGGSVPAPAPAPAPEPAPDPAPAPAPAPGADVGDIADEIDRALREAAEQFGF